MRLRSTEITRRVRCGLALFAMLAVSVSGLAQQLTGRSASASGAELAADKSAPKDSQGEAQGQGNDQDTDQNNDRDGEGLQIEPTELPDTYPQGPYHVRFHGKGNYVPTLHWKVIKGKLPPGITLNEDGMLQGAAQRAGDFNFVVAVKDGSQPQQAVQRGFVIKVVDAMTVAWKVPAHVSGNRIEGSVDVSNMTLDDIDLTYDVKAIADNGRATEIGYQHFPLKKGTTGMTLPFGETLPNGVYVVNVSVEGEIAKPKAFYRQQLQTPGPLHVAVSP
ncbi:MAG: putative Ig domain-containing protein [Candidatus Sulfotelmatobacter sp.]